MDEIKYCSKKRVQQIYFNRFGQDLAYPMLFILLGLSNSLTKMPTLKHFNKCAIKMTLIPYFLEFFSAWKGFGNQQTGALVLPTSYFEMLKVWSINLNNIFFVLKCGSKRGDQPLRCQLHKINRLNFVGK